MGVDAIVAFATGRWQAHTQYTALQLQLLPNVEETALQCRTLAVLADWLVVAHLTRCTHQLTPCLLATSLCQPQPTRAVCVCDLSQQQLCRTERLDGASVSVTEARIDRLVVA